MKSYRNGKSVEDRMFEDQNHWLAIPGVGLPLAANLAIG